MRVRQEQETRTGTESSGAGAGNFSDSAPCRWKEATIRAPLHSLVNAGTYAETTGAVARETRKMAPVMEVMARQQRAARTRGHQEASNTEPSRV